VCAAWKNRRLSGPEQSAFPLQALTSATADDVTKLKNKRRSNREIGQIARLPPANKAIRAQQREVLGDIRRTRPGYLSDLPNTLLAGLEAVQDTQALGIAQDTKVLSDELKRLSGLGELISHERTPLIRQPHYSENIITCLYDYIGI